MIAFKPNYYLDESPASFLTRISDGIGHDNVIVSSVEDEKDNLLMQVPSIEKKCD